MKNIIQNKPVTAFFLLACALSWPTGYIGLRQFEAIPDTLNTFFNYQAKFGPSIAACIIIAILSGKEGLHRLFQNLLQFRAAPKWYFVALASPTLLWLIAIAYLTSQDHPVPVVEWSAAYFIILYLLKHFFLGGGLGEELGWRGFMLPILQANHHALTASVILGAAWSLWHMPKFFIGDDGGGIGGLLLFTIYTIVLAIIFTWVYNGTQGNLFIATLFHAMINATNGFIIKLMPAVNEIESSEIYVAVGWLLLAIGIIIFAGPRRLSWSEKVTAS